ncbi:DUF707 domain-containing protein [Zavarzinia compransoris]|uniref:DUF707 domain-containing protein n=1 Tax=Zavarzinia compransoris TaxID=1264899 RepID=A0A317E3C0_9PROT|nr:DUF707 domain-containing protein [Zavarzinia compransoris]PWR21547.1 hypothetical protein DKG75_05940 [Zavarzinia compransoris]TDP45686.1 uncharacterized protein DUF707 [Zavarzinia compransoris]
MSGDTMENTGAISEIVERGLIVSRIGKRSLHREWTVPLALGMRGYDIFLSAYDPDVSPESGPGLFFEHRPGPKVAGYAGFLRDHAELIDHYDYICLMDEDVLANTETIDGFFSVAREWKLKISQPALGWSSYSSYAGLLQQPKFLLRHVNFIEMMCPIFHREALRQIFPLYESGLESGIDLVWCNLVFETPDDFAVIDAWPVTHTEPVGARMSENGFVGGRDYHSDIEVALHRARIPRLRLVPYDAVRPDGSRVSGRLRLFWAALQLLRALRRQKRKRTLIKLAMDHWLHVLLISPRNQRATWPAIML